MRKLFKYTSQNVALERFNLFNMAFIMQTFRLQWSFCFHLNWYLDIFTPLLCLRNGMNAFQLQ